MCVHVLACVCVCDGVCEWVCDINDNNNKQLNRQPQQQRRTQTHTYTHTQTYLSLTRRGRGALHRARARAAQAAAKLVHIATLVARHLRRDYRREKRVLLCDFTTDVYERRNDNKTKMERYRARVVWLNTVFNQHRRLHLCAHVQITAITVARRRFVILLDVCVSFVCGDYRMKPPHSTHLRNMTHTNVTSSVPIHAAQQPKHLLQAINKPPKVSTHVNQSHDYTWTQLHTHAPSRAARCRCRGIQWARYTWCSCHAAFRGRLRLWVGVQRQYQRERKSKTPKNSLKNIAVLSLI